jgi:hypothetical protein
MLWREIDKVTTLIKDRRMGDDMKETIPLEFL